MTNDLQTALIWLAPSEEAFKEFRYSEMTQGGEVTKAGWFTVLGWLAKAGWWVNSGEDDDGTSLVQLARQDEAKFPSDHRGPSLHAALEAAVIALHENGGA